MDTNTQKAINLMAFASAFGCGGAYSNDRMEDFIHHEETDTKTNDKQGV